MRGAEKLQQQGISSRRVRAYLSQFNTNQIHLRNPYVVAFWSMITPGLGDLLQDRQAKGLILVIWGLVINSMAKINLAILYSLSGHFEMAKQVIHTRWLLLYFAVYVYSAWSAYRGTVDMNQLYILTDREDAKVPVFLLKAWDLNYLDRRNPWVALMWSALTPGLGAFYLHKIIQGFFFVIWAIFVVYESHVLQAIQFSFTGHFEEAKAILDAQWFLYLPSIYVFEMFSAYSTAVEYNKLFGKEQSKFLRDNYQETNFKMPI